MMLGHFAISALQLAGTAGPPLIVVEFACSHALVTMEQAGYAAIAALTAVASSAMHMLTSAIVASAEQVEVSAIGPSASRPTEGPHR
jgi:hypothetical protein